MTEHNGASLQYDGGSLSLPLIQAAEGNHGYDVSKLLKQTGAVTFDPGFMNTAATTSAITYIDGDQGILRYRGYPIDQLSRRCPRSTRTPWTRSTMSRWSCPRSA